MEGTGTGVVGWVGWGGAGGRRGEWVAVVEKTPFDSGLSRYSKRGLVVFVVGFLRSSLFHHTLKERRLGERSNYSYYDKKLDTESFV